MWEAITYVSSGLTLLAFIAAIGAVIYRQQLKHTEILIKSTSTKDRGELVDRTLEFFNIDTSTLTKEQKYDLAVKQITAKSKRFTMTFITILVIISIFSAIAAYSIYVTGKQSTNYDSSSLLREKSNPVDTKFNNLSIGPNAGRDIIINNGENQKNADLRYKTSRIENISLLYTVNQWPFPTHSDGEDMYSNLTPSTIRDGLVTVYPMNSNHPRIPNKEMHIDFFIENHGVDLSVVDSIYIDVINSYPIPEFSRHNYYQPELQPSQDQVVLTSTQTKFYIFKDRQFKYSPNEVDSFRVGIMAGDGTAGKITQFRIVAAYHDSTGSHELNSDRDYLISNLSNVILPVSKGSGQEHIAPPALNQSSAITPSDLQIEATLIRDASAYWLAQGRRIWNEFDDAIISLSEGNTQSALISLDKRISRLEKFERDGAKLLDGGPQKYPCMFFRTFLYIYHGDYDQALSNQTSLLHDFQNSSGDFTPDKFFDEKPFDEKKLKEFIKIREKQPRLFLNLIVGIADQIKDGPLGVEMLDGETGRASLRPVKVIKDGSYLIEK